jgi:phosphoribosylformylglycinamidine cyclo-ligase
MKEITYKDSGVDIARGENAVDNVKSLIKSTFSKNVLGSIGGFGGLYELPAGYKKPVLVSSTDGVGTKLRVALMAGKHDTVGEDLVNHCINDIAVLGARPMYFLDYFGTATLDENVFKDVIKGFVRGCKANGVSLVGGETAEMPGIYHDQDYDLCGTIVGIIEKDKIITGKDIKKGDVLIGVESNGLHTNGYSLARRVLFGKYKIDTYIDELGCTISQELLKVHRCYLEVIQGIIHDHSVKGISHITGGGIIGNTLRVLPKGRKLSIDWNSWQKQPVFDLIRRTGSVPEDDMRRTFNMGIGLIFIISAQDSQAVLNNELLKKANYKGRVIGEVI